MDLVENSDGHLAYKSWPTETEQGPWSYRHRPWLLESHIAAVLLSFFRESYAVLYESAWTTHRERNLEEGGIEDVDWEANPSDVEGRNSYVDVETGRFFFPVSRDALEEAARFTSNGVFILPNSVKPIQVIGLARDRGFTGLTEEISMDSTAYVYADKFSNVDIYSPRIGMQDKVKQCGRLAVALWDDPAGPLRLGFDRMIGQYEMAPPKPDG